MSDITEKALDVFPPAYVILMLISGLIFLLLSPLRFFIPQLISNPFTNATATEMLAGFAVIALCSFIIGIGFFLLEDYVIGNGGFNNRFRFYIESAWNKIAKNKQAVKPISKRIKPNIDDIRFYSWMKQKGYSNYNDFFVIRDSIVRGLLLGFQATFVADSVLLLFAVSRSFLRINIHGVLVFLLLATVSGALFLAVYLYDKKIWRKEYSAIMKPIFEEYKNEPKQTQKVV